MGHLVEDKNWCSTREELSVLARNAIYAPEKHNRCWFYCINLYTLGLFQKDKYFASLHSESSFAVADGVINSILTYMKGWPKRERITGGDVFDLFLKLGSNDRKIRCFFFGSNEATLQAISSRFESLSHSAIFVGGIAPPFSETGFSNFDERYVQIINEASPDILFVGLTQPKQELWVSKNFETLKVPVTACVGAVFDFYAGNNVRAPLVMRQLGLEWVYRVVQDPIKIIRRFVYALPSLFRILQAK